MRPIDDTHRQELESWVSSANETGTDFPIQNLPFCRFQTDAEAPRIGVGIGDMILDLQACAENELLHADFNEGAASDRLNELMELSVDQRIALRAQISGFLAKGSADAEMVENLLVAQADVQLLLPCDIRDYTDFYASVFHATNVGSMFRPNNPLLPNYKHIPIGYHGRASSVVVSDTDIKRPSGQLSPAEEGGSPSFGACKLLDYELEVGVFVGQSNPLGNSIGINDAEDHLFGMCLVNDWSARDIQKWEYQPLGPFLAKSFATSISPWVVTMEALAPFRCATLERPADDPQPLEYLSSQSNTESGGVDLSLEVGIRTKGMQEQGAEPQIVSRGSFSTMYWTLAQMLTHHSSNGCNLQAGDLLASGTVSGPERGARGCMLELTWDGDKDNPVPGTQRTPLQFPDGEERKFLQNGDEVTFFGYCEAAGFRRIGFGQVRGVIKG